MFEADHVPAMLAVVLGEETSSTWLVEGKAWVLCVNDWNAQQNWVPGTNPVALIQFTSVNWHPVIILKCWMTSKHHCNTKTTCTYEPRYLTIVSSPKKKDQRKFLAVEAAERARQQHHQHCRESPWHLADGIRSILGPLGVSAEWDAKRRFSRLQNPWTYGFRGKRVQKMADLFVCFCVC